jgi:hypothetical protein
MLTLYGGAAGGHDLWSIGRQPVSYVAGQPDTIGLDRAFSSALTLGTMFTLYSAGSFGVSVDLDYRSVTLDDTCAPVVPFQADTEERNRHLCDNISASANSGSAIGVAVAANFRMAAHAAVSPYVRGGARFTNMTISTLALEAADTLGSTPRLVIDDPSPRRSTIGFLLAGGITSALGPGYQFRLEIRDHIHTIAIVDGPANGLGVAPASNKLFHHPSLIVALDVVLEQRRGRRY